MYEAHADARDLRREMDLPDPPYLALFQPPIDQAEGSGQDAPAQDKEE